MSDLYWRTDEQMRSAAETLEQGGLRDCSTRRCVRTACRWR